MWPENKHIKMVSTHTTDRNARHPVPTHDGWMQYRFSKHTHTHHTLEVRLRANSRGRGMQNNERVFCLYFFFTWKLRSAALALVQCSLFARDNWSRFHHKTIYNYVF